MKAKVSILGVLIMAFLMITGVVHAAPVTIDSFAVEAQSLSVASGSLIDSGVTVNNGAILGGERDAYLELLSGTSTSNLDINAGGSGIVAFSAGSGSDLKATIVWDGDDDDPDPTTGVNYAGLAGEDLTSTGTNDGVALTVYDWEGNDLDIIVTIYTDASNYSSATLSLRGNGQIDPPGEIYGLAFDEAFATGSGASGPADFTNVGAVVLEIVTVATGADVSMDLALATATRDFGDLPADYGITTVANNGARHTQDAVYLGTVLDTEVDGTTSSGADADDIANNDEEGVTRSGTWTEGAGGGAVQFTITSPHPNNYACVDGWIDWNDDNDFDDADEHVIDSVALLDLGIFDNLEQSFDIPVGGLSHSALYSRWRIAPDTDGDGVCTDEVNMSYTGHVSGGEVEDYQWVLAPSAISLGAFGAAHDAPAIPFAFVAVLMLSLLGTGALVYRRRVR